MAACLSLGTLLVVAGYWLKESGAWHPYAPTPVLLALNDEAFSPVFLELVRRYQASKLTPAQGQQFFDQILQPRADFELIDPHPAYVPIRVKLDVAFNEYGLARQLTAIGTAQIWVDDVQVDAQAAPPTNGFSVSMMPMSSIRKWGEFVVLPGLPPGKHEVVFVQNYLFLQGTSPAVAVPPACTLRVSQTIKVVNQPASAFVTPELGDERGELRGEIRLQLDPPRAWHEPFGRVIPLRFANVAAPVVGMLEVRLDAEREFRAIKPIVVDGTEVYRESIDLSGISGIDVAQRADVRIMPASPELVIEYGLRTCHGRAIEWPDVLLAIDVPASEADEGLAKVLEFLEGFGGPSGAPYRGKSFQLRFEDKLAVLPTALQRDLKEHYPRYRFGAARMRYFLGWHTGPINLLVVSDADSGEVRTHAVALWMGNPAADFTSTLCGLPCRDVEAVERKTHTLASFLAFAMDGEVGPSALNQSDRTVDVQIFWPHWSMKKPYRNLRFSYDEQLRISRVEVYQPQKLPSREGQRGVRRHDAHCFRSMAAPRPTARVRQIDALGGEAIGQGPTPARGVLFS